MAHLSSQTSSDFSGDRLMPVSPDRFLGEVTHDIRGILLSYKTIKEIFRTINEITSFSDSELITSIYDKLLHRSPTASEAADVRIDAIRDHTIRQLSEVCNHLQKSLLRLLSEMPANSFVLTVEEKKNTQLAKAADDLLLMSKGLVLTDDFKSLREQLERLQELFERHTHYNKTLHSSIEDSSLEGINSEKKVRELYWVRRMGISHRDFLQLLEHSPSLITLCEQMSEEGLPLEVLPERLNRGITADADDSDKEWLGALAAYHRGLHPLERHATLLNPIYNKVLLSHTEGIRAQIEQLSMKRAEPNWIAVLSCRILCDEGIKLLKRQRNLSHLAPEVSRLVAEDYYGALLATGIQHSEALQSLIPSNTQKESDKAVDLLRAQKLLRREYFTSPTSSKISHFFSPGGKDHVMWNTFLNLLVTLEKGVDSFEAALCGGKSLLEKSQMKSLHPAQIKKSIKGLLQDSLTTLRIFTYQDRETGKQSEYLSQIGILRQSLSKVPLEAIDTSERGLFEICRNYFYLPFSNSTVGSEFQEDQIVLSQLIAIVRRSCNS